MVSDIWSTVEKFAVQRRQKASAFHDAFTALLAVLLFAAVVSMVASSFYLSLFIIAAKSKDLFQFLFTRCTWLHSKIS